MADTELPAAQPGPELPSIPLGSLFQIACRVLMPPPRDELRELQIRKLKLEIERATDNSITHYQRVPFDALIDVPTVAFIGPTGSGKTASALALARMTVAKYGGVVQSNSARLGELTPLSNPKPGAFIFDDDTKDGRKLVALADALQHRRHSGTQYLITAPLGASMHRDALRYAELVVLCGFNEAQQALDDLPEIWMTNLARAGKLQRALAEQNMLAGWLTANGDLLAFERPALPEGWTEQTSRWTFFKRFGE